MERENHSLVKKIIAATVSLMMVITMLPFSVFAAESEDSVNKLLDLDKQTPEGFDPGDTTNPYGYDVGEPFMMAAQNELLTYITKGVNEGDQKSNIYEGFNTGEIRRHSITTNKMSDKSVFKNTDTGLNENMKVEQYVEGVAFDPNGTGRKDHVAYIGYRPDLNGVGHVVVWVVNTNNKKSSVVYDAGGADWIKDAGFEQFYSGNFFAITAGKYHEDGGDTFVTYAPLGNNNFGLQEWKIATGEDGKITLSKVAQGQSYLHDAYRNTNWEGPEMATSGVHKNMLSASLTTGDFNGDGIDDLAALSYLNRPKEKYKGINPTFFAPQLTTVYGGGSESIINRTNNVKSTLVRKNITESGADKNTFLTMRSPSITAGDSDGDGFDEIIAAGYSAHTITKTGDKRDTNTDTPYERKTAVTVAAYNFDNKNLSGFLFETYENSDSNSIMNEYTKQIVNKHNDDIMPVFALETIAIDGASNPEYIFLNGTFCLMNGNGGLDQKYTPDYFTRWDGTAGYLSISRNFISSVAVGVFDDNTVGREQIAVSVGMKENGENDYAYMLGVMGGRNYKDTVDKNGNITEYGTVGNYFTTGFDKDSYDYGNNNKDHERKNYEIYNAGGGVNQNLNCIVVAVDTGYDGTVARYKGKTYAYSNPDVVAVLQAAPYFSDFGNVGATSYGISTSYTITNMEEESVSYSVGVTAEAAAPGVKLTVGSGYTGGWSKSFETAYTETHGITFTAQNDNSVVVQRTPVFMYMYELQDSNGEWLNTQNSNDESGDGQGAIQITIPQKPVYSQLNVDKYNQFVDAYNNKLEAGSTPDARLGKIESKSNKRYTSLINNAGNPGGYASNWNDLLGKQIGKNTNELGYTDSQTTVYASESADVTQGTSRNSGFYFEASVSAGASMAFAEAWVGVSTGVEGSKTFGQSTTQTSAKDVSGTVTGLDAMAHGQEKVEGYGFNWEFGTWTVDLAPRNKAQIPVFGYVIKNLRAGLDAPQNLIAVQGKNDKTIDLSWDSVNKANGYNLYLIENGIATKANSSPITDTKYSYQMPDNIPSFTFVVTAVKDNIESIDSNQAIFYRSNFGKSAYDIARDNGFVGTEEEWLASLMGANGTDGKDGVGIEKIEINDSGMLQVTLSDGTNLTLGDVVGSDGADGTGIAGLSINENGELIVELTDDSLINLGVVVGKKGDKGEDGREIELQTSDTHIRWRYVGEGDDAWRNLLALSDIAGANGQDGIDGKDIELKAENDAIYWRLKGDEIWIKLISIEDIKGDKGDKGDKGEDGREIELQTNDTHIRWRYIGEGDDAWRDLIALSDITGTNGQDGVDGKNIELKVENGAVYWRLKGDKNWIKLISVEEIKGDKGDDGVGILSAKINENGNLIITLTDGKVLDVGKVTGIDGINGVDGVGIKLVDIDINGNLIITLTNDNVINLGRIVGKDGINGTNGKDGTNGINGTNGKDGKNGTNVKTNNVGSNTDTAPNEPSTGSTNTVSGISDIKINEDGNFIFTIDDGKIIDAGKIKSLGASGNDVAALRAEVEDLKSQLNTTKIVANVGVTFGTLGFIGNAAAVIFYFIKRRKI